MAFGTLVAATAAAASAFACPASRVRDVRRRAVADLRGGGGRIGGIRARRANLNRLAGIGRGGAVGDDVDDCGDGEADLSRLASLFGGTSPDDALRLDRGADGVRGVYANRPVKEGETVLAMPLSSCLRDDEPPPWFGDYQYRRQLASEKEEVDAVAESDSGVRIQGGVTRLAACVLEMRHAQRLREKGGEAPSRRDRAARAWLDLFPTPSSFRACLPVHWPEPLWREAVDYRPLELTVDAARSARAPVVDELTEAVPKSHFVDASELRERVEWALDVAQTRSIRRFSRGESSREAGGGGEGDGLLVLVPAFDMINHSPEPNAEFSQEGDYLVVRALSDIAEEEQVCVHYGDSAAPAWRRLFSYGFCDTSGEDGLSIYEEDTVEIVLEDRYRFEVSPAEFPMELVQYQARRMAADVAAPSRDVAADGGEPSDQIEFTPEIGQGIVDQLVSAADETERKRDHAAGAAADAEDAPVGAALVLVTDLHESHRRTLLACAGGLREYLQEEEDG